MKTIYNGLLNILFFLGSLILYSNETLALVPMESLILGDLSDEYGREERDPIEYIFRQSLDLHKVTDSHNPLFSYKKELGRYRGFYEEASNLKNSCEKRQRIPYSTNWNREQVKRSILATLQYVGLDLTLRALPAYAKYFEFTTDEYKNLGINLIGNYCSANLSVISIEELKKNWNARFTRDNSFTFPSVKGNPLFPEKLSTIIRDDSGRTKEFARIIELFKSFCSWGGDTDNLRLLVPLVRNPIVMSFLNRQMSGQYIDWEKTTNRNYLKERKNTVQVYCENLICRKVSSKVFKRKIPRAIGSSSLIEDFNRLYCSDFRHSEYLYKDQEPKLKKIIKSITYDEQNFLTGQFVSLITGVPDFLMLAEKYDEGKLFLRSSIDKKWNTWASEQNNNYQRDIYYEESITIELVRRKHYFNKRVSKFSVELDVNMGEFDRANSLLGKIKTQFHLNLSKSFLVWAKNNWKDIDVKDKKKRDKVLIPFRKLIGQEVAKARSRIKLFAWKGDLEKIIMYEILEQFSQYRGSFFDDKKGIVQIPISLNYAPFALQHIRYKWLVKENEKKRWGKRVSKEKLRASKE